VEAKSDTSLFVYRHDADTAYLLLYVDDIVLTPSSPELLQHTTTALQQQFVMKDLGPLHHFLDILVEQRSDDLFLHHHQYARDILERAGMSDCKPCSTLVDTQVKVSSDMGGHLRPDCLPQHGCGSPVPHLHQARYCLRGPAGVPPHVRPP
jgi:hypothetical protein